MQDHTPHILVVDDDHDVREVLALLLEAEGFRVDTATGGRTGLAKLREDRVDLVLLDVVMPEMDGFEFLRELRGDPLLSALPVILCSASCRLENDALPGGAIGLIHKPVDPRRLFDLIEKVLES